MPPKCPQATVMQPSIEEPGSWGLQREEVNEMLCSLPLALLLCLWFHSWAQPCDYHSFSLLIKIMIFKEQETPEAASVGDL